MKDHVVICGFGTKGRAATDTLLGHGYRPDQLVAVDESATARSKATELGISAVAGSATTQHALVEAGIEAAAAVVVAVDRDDSAVLVTLTARDFDPESAHLGGGARGRERTPAARGRRQLGDHVLGRRGQAARPRHHRTRHRTCDRGPALGQGGLDIVQRPVSDADVGPLEELRSRNPVVAISRGGELLRFDDERAAELRPGDALVEMVEQGVAAVRWRHGHR